MAVAFVNKVFDFLGLDNSSEEKEEAENIYDNSYDKQEEIEEEESEVKNFFGRKNKVINMPQVQQVRMFITRPTTFEQSEEICNYLKEKKAVIVNLEYVNKDVARRIIDFTSGAIHALNGSIQKVSNAIFLVTPANYEVASDLAREELKNKLSVSWLKNI